MELADWIIVCLAGGLGGLMAGMLGVGGGVIFVPIISHFVEKWIGDSPHFSAIVMANSFLVILFIGIVGTLKQRKLGVFYPKIGLTTGLVAVVFSLLTSSLFVATPYYSKALFTYFFIIMLSFVLLRFLFQAYEHKTKVNKGLTSSFSVSPKHYLLPGMFSGIIAALSGLGGGIILIPYFTQLLKMPIKTATAVSLFVITISAFPLVTFYLLQDVSTIPNGYLHTGFVLWELSIPLLVGAILFVRVGVNLSKRLSPVYIFLLLSLFIFITIINMIASL